MRPFALLPFLSLAPLAAGIPSSDLPSALRQSLELRAADADPDDRFGYSVAIDGGLAVVGAITDDELGLYRGAAYVFDLASGAQLHKLLPGDLDDWQGYFGISVAIEDELVVVGARDSVLHPGAAYVFDATTGAQLAKLQASDAQPGQTFGSAVAVRGRRILVGSSRDDEGGERCGALYVFDATTWAQTAKLLPADPLPGRHFGTSLAVHGERVLVGAPGHNGGLSNSGAAYLFDLATGLQIGKLVPDDPTWGKDFGARVDLSADRALASAIGDNHAGSHSGSAYLFEPGSGAQLMKLVASDGAEGDGFGWGLAFEGDTIAVGTPGHGFYDGSAELFSATTGAPLTSMAPSRVSSRDQLGSTLAMQDATVLVGSPGVEQNAGAAYVFRRPLGAAYCTAAPNSVSADGARLWTFGSRSVAVGQLVLTAESVPDQAGLFFYGPAAVQLPFGDGFRCVGGALRRFPMTTASGGTLETRVDLEVHGQDLVALGTAYFQAWYRDPAFGGAGFNLSDARELEFLP